MNRGIKDLQSFALPLGHAADFAEPAVFARWRPVEGRLLNRKRCITRFEFYVNRKNAP